MSQAKTFGRYNLIRKVAQGGMAEIFLAKFQGIGGFEKKIIIKRILPRFSENQEFIKMLIHEAKTAVQLHHQNIVQIYDLGKVRDAYFISMEYIRGKDLRTVLNRLKSQGQQMPRELAVFIAREICKGLDYAHNITDQHGEPLNLVHRDISPPNILLSLEGEVKIIDFGIAKATSQATDTQAGVFKGKFAYMAPEQASGVPVDRRADIFATGLILWEMLTTRKLLEAESDIATLERAKKIDSYDPPFADFAIPDQLEHIIRKALKQDRGTRYQSAGEMARDLTIYLNLNYPGFSETDLADFLRTLFNLDKRRGGASGDLISHGQGERSLTGSDFFRALAQTGQEHTDPSVKLNQDAAQLGSSASGGPQPSAGAVAAAAVAAIPSQPASSRRKPEGRGAGEGEYWSLENDIRDEIEVFALGTAAPPGGAAPAEGREANGQVGWVSQLAEDFVRAEDGTLHPLISGALRPTGEGAPGERPGPGEPTGLAPDSKGATSASSGQARTGREPGTSRSTASATTAGTTSFQTSRGRSGGMWAAILMAVAFMFLVGGALAFPDKMQALKESLGLVAKAEVELHYAPADAAILVNGRPLAATANPVRLQLPIGQRHLVRIQKEGFEEQQVSIDLVAARSHAPVSVTLNPELPRGNGTLELSGMLPDAVVYINGRPTVPEQLQALPTGVPLQVKVSKEHYIPFETQVTLGEAPQALTVTLQPLPVSLTVDGCPPRASVLVDDRVVGECPFHGDGFQPGTVYKLQVVAPGYTSQPFTWTPTVGNPFRVRGGGLTPIAAASAPVPVRRTMQETSAGAPAAQQRPAQPVTASSPPATAPTQPSSLNASTSPEPPPQDSRVRKDTVKVQIVATPWAEVYLDGKYLGRTPVSNITVKVGRHTIRLVNNDLQIDYTQEKEITPTPYGETLVYSYELG